MTLGSGAATMPGVERGAVIWRTGRGEKTRTVVIAFDSVEAARTAHASPAYQEALAALDGGAVRDVRIVPGVE